MNEWKRSFEINVLERGYLRLLTATAEFAKDVASY